MFFANDNMLVDLIGVFKIERSAFSEKAAVEREYDSLSVRLKGSGTFFAEGTEYALNEGDFIYLPYNQKYTQSSDGETVIAIHFINYNQNTVQKIEALTPEKYEETMDVINRMYILWIEKKTGFKYECTALLYHLLYLFRNQEERCSQSFGSDNLLAEAIDYIHKNYNKERVFISDLAKRAAVSEVHFRKLFKRVYGISPTRYIINLKLKYAAALLQSGFYTVSEVAEKSGFSDVKYFQRLFKAKYHNTPNSYKNLNLK